MVISLRTLSLRRSRHKPLSASDLQNASFEAVDARELKRMRDELRLAREKARLADVLYRNRIF